MICHQVNNWAHSYINNTKNITTKLYYYSARSSKKFRNGIEPEVVEEEQPEDLDGSFKRRRFQSAFRVPNSNRTSIVENTNDTLVDRNDDDQDDEAFEINPSGMMYENSDEEDNDSEDEYMRQNY